MNEFLLSVPPPVWWWFGVFLAVFGMCCIAILFYDVIFEEED